MKNCSRVVFSLIFITTFALAQDQSMVDQPALGPKERSVLALARNLGGTFGVFAGVIGVPKVSSFFQSPFDTRPKTVSRMVTEVAGGAGVGAYLGYKALDRMAIFALSKFHGVSYRVEAISLYYNINLSQYKELLIAAAQQEPEDLLKDIDSQFTKRFGSNWKERLNKLFKKYDKRTERLARAGKFVSSFEQSGDRREFSRMVELGAAMADLFYGTSPDRKQTFASAKKLYKELGILE